MADLRKKIATCHARFHDRKTATAYDLAFADEVLEIKLPDNVMLVDRDIYLLEQKVLMQEWQLSNVQAGCIDPELRTKLNNTRVAVMKSKMALWELMAA